MPLPVLEIAGLASNLIGGILGSQEAKKRQKALQKAAWRLYMKQQRDFNQAFFLTEQEIGRFDADPARAQAKALWDAALQNPDVINPAQLSVMKAQGMDTAARNTGATTTAIREQAQRSGLRGTGVLAVEAGARAGIAGRNQAIANDLDINVGAANRRSRDALRAGYSDFMLADSAARRSISSRLVDLLGSKRYDQSSMLAFM